MIKTLSQTLLLMTIMACGRAEPAVQAVVSHPPLRLPVLSSDLKLPDGPMFFVDPVRGRDDNSGSMENPWRTVQTSILKLRPGDTLLLRGGVYFENVICSIEGQPDKPITIRGFPGETAILDGSLREFQEDPAGAWVAGAAPGEFVSSRVWPNLRDVLGLFSDSNVGLQTYWYRGDLVSEREVAAGKDEDAREVFTYCGPGLFYDRTTGLIHVRLAPTNNNRPPLHDYRGPQDPRTLPLVISPFRSVPLHIDLGRHLRFRDLIIRGGGYNCVVLEHAIDVEFDHVTVFGGTYCVRAKGSGPVKMIDCGIYGQIPPWSYMSENALQTPDPVHYSPFSSGPETKRRNIARLPTHALLVTEGAEESDVFYYPFNNRWEITRSEFADGHDGVYLNGRDMWMHHCWIDNMQDDAIYISSPTPGVCDDVHFSRNYISKCKTAIGSHTRGGPDGHIYIYGNVIDMREWLPDIRVSPDWPEGRIIRGASLFTPHGIELLGMENLVFAHNTALLPGAVAAEYAGRTYLGLTARTQRTSVNSIYVYLEAQKGGPDARPPLGPSLIDGNLHWWPGADIAEGNLWLEKIRNSVKSEMNQTEFQGLPWDGRGKFGDPGFASFSPDPATPFAPAITERSPAVGLAVEFPGAANLRNFQAGNYAGAIGPEEEVFQVGIRGRIRAGTRPALPVPSDLK
jgi:hypothetical protein